jgi:site-specific DNA-methyltransferase (adenine-specific)
LWEQYRRIAKKDAPIVLNASQPFTSALVMSNPTYFKYDWVWDKHIVTGFLNAKIRPLVLHESILVFSFGKPRYFPIMTVGKERLKGARKGTAGQVYGAADSNVSVKSSLMYPKSILSISNADRSNRVHPTQKPVALMEYLIRTYTNEGETVLDNCMGSGTTGVACVKMGRKFIGIELDPTYFEIAKKRIKEAE